MSDKFPKPIKIKKQPASFKCALCRQIFSTNKDLISHKSVHAKKSRVFTCPQCQESFTDHCLYLLHEVTHLHNRDVHKCIECGAVKKKICVTTHIMSHFSRKKPTCEICGIVLSNEQMKIHVRTHSTLEKKVNCSICGKMISEKKLQSHLSTHEEKSFSCQFCKLTFKKKYLRTLHERRHTGQKLFICNLCGHRGYSSYAITRHKRGHFEENKYECDYCHKVCYIKSELSKHIKLHTVGYKCRYKGCKYVATTKEQLKSHKMKTHFYCDTCLKGYCSKKVLLCHYKSKTHTELL